MSDRGMAPASEKLHEQGIPGDPAPIQRPAEASQVDHNSVPNHDPVSSSSQQQETSSKAMDRSQFPAGEAIFLIVICFSQLLTQAGLASSIVPQQIIARSFGIETQPAEVSWFSAGYSLTVGTFILIAGRLGDIFGHKRFFVAGFAWLGLWSALAGVAVYGGPILFAFCRAMQGIGPAFLLPNAIAILAKSYEPGLRQNMIFSLFGATAPSGFLFGAVFASLFSQLAWWPWAYWTMCLTSLILAAASVFTIPAQQSSNGTETDKPSTWERVDPWGSLTGVTGLVLFNFAWNQGSVVGWSTPYTYIILIISIVVFIVFLVIEKNAQYPLVPLGILKADSYFVLACICAGWSSFGIFTFYAIQFLEVQRNQTALLTSAQFAPIAISGLCAAVTTGFMLSRFRTSTVMFTSMAAFLVGGTIFATMPVDQSYWAQAFVAVIILPWGMDMSFPAATIILSRAMPREQQGLAASLVNTLVNYSISLGLGMAGTVDSAINEGGSHASKGYQGAFYMAVGLSGLGVVVSLVFCVVERIRSSSLKETIEEPNQV